LAKKAAKVTAVDFIEKFVEKNREVNSNFNNIDFIHGDVTKLEFQKNG
jgi:phosphoethanolamine N-methyltransferase